MSPSDIERSDHECLRDILACTEAIDRALVTLPRYPDDVDILWLASQVLQHLASAIGEAIKGLSPEVREDHPAVAWSEMTRLGELIRAQDDELDPQVLGATIGEPVKRLRSACRAILAESARAGEDEP